MKYFSQSLKVFLIPNAQSLRYLPRFERFPVVSIKKLCDTLF
jgi:hypothetical protein